MFLAALHCDSVSVDTSRHHVLLLFFLGIMILRTLMAYNCPRTDSGAQCILDTLLISALYRNDLINIEWDIMS